MSGTILFLLLLLIVAFLYASVGHGGASGYLALMALFSMSPAVMRPTALMLNLFVSLSAFILFYRGGHFKWKIFLPFALASIPCSFIGGMIEMDAAIYKKILGILLLIAVARMLLNTNGDEQTKNTPDLKLSLLIGAVIGFLSGLIGIGGGIILSPALLMMSWTTQKQTAAISALFIFVNSVAGLAGQFSQGISLQPDMLAYVGVAFVGGSAGAWMGAAKLDHKALKYLLSIVLIVASIKLLLT